MKNNFFNFLKIKFLNDIIFYQTILFCISLLVMGVVFIGNFKDNFIHSIIEQELSLFKKNNISKMCEYKSPRSQFYILNANRTIRCGETNFKINEFKGLNPGSYRSEEDHIFYHETITSKEKVYTLFIKIKSDALKLMSKRVFSKLFLAMGILGFLFLAGQFFLFKHYFSPLYSLFKLFRMKNKIDTSDSRDYWDYIESKSQKNFNKRRELKLEIFNTKQYYSVILNSIDDPVVATDNKGIIVFSNDSFRKTFSSFNGKYRGVEIINIIRDYDFINLIRKSGYNAHLIHNSQVELKSVEGSNHVYQLKTSNIKSKKKNYELFFYFSDITKLQDVNNMRRDFFENVSHEIKTPLTSIKGYSQTLQSINEDKDQAEILDIISQNVDRLDELINGILSLSKIENEGKIEVEEINIPEFINALINDYQLKLNEKDISIQINEDNLKTLNTDKRLLYHCISNLITNAIKYSLEKTQITINYSSNKDGSYISVQDQGVGIPNDKIARIFERFYRVDSSRSINTGGTGLGLAITKHSAQKMGAIIDVESQLNEGTKFTIFFPNKVIES
ncbi:sensor histidine kinase [Halobacteriovorax sp.]|uniref:sensor histidine kinase n=1 Tax=Halobacteriovorax sp. TaxID=2020862 RepID=UPI003AF28833